MVVQGKKEQEQELVTRSIRTLLHSVISCVFKTEKLHYMDLNSLQTKVNVFVTTCLKVSHLQS